MPDRLIRLYTCSAGAMLLAASTMLFIGDWASTGLTLPLDPIFKLSVRHLLEIVGGIFLLVALLCLFGEKVRWQAGLVAWLALNYGCYRAGMVWSGYRESGVFVGLWRMLSGFRPGFWPSPPTFPLVRF